MKRFNLNGSRTGNRCFSWSGSIIFSKKQFLLVFSLHVQDHGINGLTDLNNEKTSKARTFKIF